MCVVARAVAIGIRDHGCSTRVVEKTDESAALASARSIALTVHPARRADLAIAIASDS
jgi:hypothetical protein